MSASQACHHLWRLGIPGPADRQGHGRAGLAHRVAVRRPNGAGVVRTYGAPGQIEPVPCNVRDDLSVRACMSDADAVINCVGILVREGKNTFRRHP